ncbi:MAG: PDZ domain-containing protein [Opitutaceae bacterium]
MRLRHLFSLLFVLLVSGVLRAGTLPAVNYTLRFPEALHHYVEVEADLPTDGQDNLQVFMPVWTPGSYLVREYARNIDRIDATAPDGTSLVIDKTLKNRWSIATQGHDRVRVTYRLYGWEASVRTNFIEGDFAILNGAPTFLTVADNYQRPYTVRLELPAGWAGSYTPLAPADTPHTYRAPDFDTLIDSPILAGSPQVDSFVLEGSTHYVVTVGGAGEWDNARAARNFEQIAKTQIEFWGGLPTKEPYYVFNLLIGGRGGLEHKQAFVMMEDRWKSATRSGIKSWLSLVSHEYFHVWNGKRLRPVELGPFPYEHEAYTKTLWVVEGITSYYQHLLLRRAGYHKQTDYLNAVSGSIAGIERTPGRLVQSLSESSFDAWIKGYRPDENSANTRISYYSAGSVAAFLLDAEIRRLSGGAKSLDDVMRTAYARFSGERGYTEDEFTAVASEVAGADLAPWFERIVRHPGQFDYQPALDWYGLMFEAPKKPDDSALPNGLEPPDAPKGWLGADLRGNVVSGVRHGTPAYDAGLYVNDEIVAVDGFRTSGSPDAVIRFRQPGDTVELLVARRGQLIELPVTLGEEPSATWRLKIRPDATPEQTANLNAWLGSDEHATEDVAPADADES